MSDNLILKSIENKKDVESTLSFLCGILSHDMNQEIWNWEFDSFPNDVILKIIKDKEETVGTQFILPIKLGLNGTEHLSGKCENSYFDTSYRGKGLFKKLFTLAENTAIEKKTAILWAFTPATKVYKEKLNFEAFVDIMNGFSTRIGMPKLSFIKSYTNSLPKLYLKYIYHTLVYMAFKLRYGLFSFKKRSINRTKQYVVKKQPNSFKDIDNLYSKLRQKDGDFIHVKLSESYFEWRIIANVNLNYITKFFYEGEVVAGYYILALQPSANAANITDFTSLDEDVSAVMILDVIKEASKLSISNLNYFGNKENSLNQRNFNLLKNFGGSIKLVEGMPFVYKNISTIKLNNTFLGDAKNWYLNGLWREGFVY